MASQVGTRQPLDQTNLIHKGHGVAHWAVYKNADENPEYPWFAEHRLIQSTTDLRWPHDADDRHEYGSFATHAEALAAALDWFAVGCRDYEERELWWRQCHTRRDR